MELILHVGAHRTATTSFQAYLGGNTAALLAGGTGVWGPQRTRGGLLHGLGDRPGTAAEVAAANRAAGRLRVNIARARVSGLDRLIVSEENMLGTTRRNLRARRLYPDAGERMARFAGAMGRIDRVIVTIRAQDAWWASALSYLVARGVPVPDAAALADIAQTRRGWRDVVLDLACAVPGADLVVVPFDRGAGRPDLVFTAATGQPAPAARRAVWKNRAPDRDTLRRLIADRGEAPRSAVPPGAGRWRPFDTAQTAALRAAWADDIHWLRAGADGLARLVEHTDSGSTAAVTPGLTETEVRPLPTWRAAPARGRWNDQRQGRVG